MTDQEQFARMYLLTKDQGCRIFCIFILLLRRFCELLPVSMIFSGFNIIPPPVEVVFVW